MTKSPTVNITITTAVPPPPPPPTPTPTPSESFSVSVNQPLPPYLPSSVTIVVTPPIAAPGETLSMTISGISGSPTYILNLVRLSDGSRFFGTSGTLGSSGIASFTMAWGFGWGTFGLDVTLQWGSGKNFIGKHEFLTADSIYLPNLGVTLIPGFNINIPQPTLSIKDAGRISSTDGVSTHTISGSLVSPAGPIAGKSVALVELSPSLTALGTATTDANGNFAFNVTFTIGETVTLTASTGAYPATGYDIEGNQISVQF